MGKLICDLTTSSPVIPWKDPTAAPPSIDTIAAVDLSEEMLIATTTTWDDVSGLEDQQKRHLQRLHAKGFLWKHPGNKILNQCQEDDSTSPAAAVFRLSHSGDVEADGNCLFTASQNTMGLKEINAKDLRRRTVRRFPSIINFPQTITVSDENHYTSPTLFPSWHVRDNGSGSISDEFHPTDACSISINGCRPLPVGHT